MVMRTDHGSNDGAGVSSTPDIHHAEVLILWLFADANTCSSLDHAETHRRNALGVIRLGLRQSASHHVCKSEKGVRLAQNMQIGP